MTGSAAGRLRADLAIAAAVLVLSGVWGAQYWKTWTARGGQARFYQEYFEPAVMIACGRGFAVASPPAPAALTDFLLLGRDSFECSELPQDLPLDRDRLHQKRWRYLMNTVAWTWRLFGISWSRMGPLFGLLFGSVIALAYGIFRLGMSRPIALVGALGLSISSAHLLQLPHLRDYAKAPFMLALILVLGWLVTLPVRRTTLLALAAAYGAVLGVGFGFRADFLVSLPLIIVALFAFLPDGIANHLGLKSAAAALALVTFMAVSWPVTSASYTNGSCQWHLALLGLQAPFDGELHIAPAPYDFGYAYSDSYMNRIVTAYARRMPPGIERVELCSHEYDSASGRYFAQLVATFPADLSTRAFASVLRVVDLPFRWWDAPMPDWASWLYRVRAALLRPARGRGLLVVVPALVLASTASLRMAFFLLFLVLYLGGYPALQFADRHYFHLELITWWAGGFIVQQAFDGLKTLRADGVSASSLLAFGRVRRAAAFLAISFAALAGSVSILRWYQHRQVASLVEAYIAASKRQLLLPEAAADAVRPIPPSGPGEAEPPTWQFTTQFLEIVLNESACGPSPSVTFRYDHLEPELDFSHTMTIGRRSARPGPTRIFFAAYEHFKGIELSDATPGCFVSASRFADLRTLPVLLNATIAPDWQQQPLHQRLADWEGK